MKFSNLFLTAAVTASLIFTACKKESDTGGNNGGTDKCATKSIQVGASTMGTAPCSSSGILIAHVTGSTGFSYQLNGGAFTSDSVFNNLAAGTYTLTAKDAEGCQKSGTFTILESGSKGTLFTTVSSIINTKCNQACHTSGAGGAPAGIFSTDCKIVSRSADIKLKAVDDNMGSLTTTQKNQIMNWINAGGRYTD